MIEKITGRKHARKNMLETLLHETKLKFTSFS